MTFLNEGMQKGDLKGLVMPLISVDEYVSKVDDRAIVFGFYVHDEDAAMDLNRFIQRSAITLLDADLSTAPDQTGYYMVFVELLNDDKTADQFDALLGDIASLTAIPVKTWKMQIRRVKKKLDYTKTKLERTLLHLRTDDKEVLEFFQPSGLERCSLNESVLEIGTGGWKSRYVVVGFGRPDTILETLGLASVPLRLDLTECARTNAISSHLGTNWSVFSLGNAVIFSRAGHENWLVTRPVSA